MRQENTQKIQTKDRKKGMFVTLRNIGEPVGCLHVRAMILCWALDCVFLNLQMRDSNPATITQADSEVVT